MKLLSDEERISIIKNKVSDIINKYEIEVVVIEDYSFMSRGRAVFSLGELGGAIKNMIFEKKIPIVKVSPPALKKFITGKGNSDKNVMLMKIYKNYGKEFLDDNIADAFALGKYYFDYVIKQVGK